ncbi:hypothetical protein L218DRAFT_897035 [Marasmius fiardii PR-910]|nr:hypothetical protein L218DRAFT_897035 [Marasmius fiardii PR-910]
MRGVESTPDSPLTMASSLEHATSTIDELTQALANFSRLPSPEPPSIINCCCRREDCENLRAWSALKARLESRLTLSAEIGQALLHRSDIFSQRHEALNHKGESSNEEYASGDDSESQDDECRLSQLTKEKRDLERRLTQALVNSEVTEVSNKTILQELQEANLTISRLSSHHARSVGWETRLSAATKERDDMQQERDFESQRARLAESRFVALKERTSKLQVEVRRLQDELQEKRVHRLESSKSIIQEARSQLQILHQSLGNTHTTDTGDFTQMLESLVDDNEVLKRDNTELQTLLAQSRDDMYALQQEVEEQRALNIPRSRAVTPLSPHLRHAYSGSMPASLLREQLAPILSRREASLERKTQRSFEPLTPETTTMPLSPTDSTFSRSRQPPSPYLVESQDADADVTSTEKPRTHKTLYLLTRSRGVQTDAPPTHLSPSLAPTPSPYEYRSESSSSYSESYSSTMSTLVDRMGSFLKRMAEADVLTLTQRLKRQHLRGADVGHVSRSTVSNIVNEVTSLRAQFRYLLEDEKLVTPCTRKDLRAIFNLFREIFVEMGQMRVTLNDIVLDPSIAPKISELALDPKKASESTGSAGGWIAPISKLFGASTTRVDYPSSMPNASGLMRTPSAKGNSRPPRFVPKLGPATSASTTTVNVEFSGSAVGRAVTSTSQNKPSQEEGTVKLKKPTASNSPASTKVMGIFAGAPVTSTADPDPWVILPRQPRRVQSTIRPGEMISPANAGRVKGLQAEPASGHSRRLSRNVDAIIDTNQHLGQSLEGDEASDQVAPLLERTLRRRGLSDSSIHSSFIAGQGEISINSDVEATPNPSRGSVFQALSKKVFRTGTSATPGSSYKEPSPLAGRRGAVAERDVGVRTVPGLSSFITSWASSGHALDPTLEQRRTLLVGTPPRDDLLANTFGSMRGEDVYY